METPLITIGITCYKAHDTIEKAIKSALNQTWENKEIIVVDDGSDDRTVERLQELQEIYKSIQIIYQSENKGVAATRNEIIKQASGDFICFFDDDDESLPERIKTQYQRITEYEKQYAQECAVISYSTRLQKYPDGSTRLENTIGTNEGTAPHGDAVALRILTGKPQPNIFGSMATCSQMARINTYRNLQGFDEDFRRSEDTEFNVRAAISGAHFVGLKEALVMQTMTLASDKTLADECLYTFKLVEKHKNFIDKHYSYPFNTNWLIAKYDFLQKKKGVFAAKMLGLFIRHPFLTLQRLSWAMPNISFNIKFSRLHNEQR